MNGELVTVIRGAAAAHWWLVDVANGNGMMLRPPRALAVKVKAATWTERSRNAIMGGTHPCQQVNTWQRVQMPN